MLNLKFKKLCPETQPPYHGSADSAGWDLTAVARSYDLKAGCWVYRTGLAVEIPKGYVGLLFPRSSVFRKPLTMAYCVGVVDADYRGEVLAIFRGGSRDMADVYAVGDRCAQLVVVPVPQVSWTEAEELSQTERGAGGYGSTGGGA